VTTKPDALFRKAFLSSPVATIYSNTSHLIVASNQAADRLFGSREGGLAGLRTRDLYALDEDWLKVRNTLDGLALQTEMRPISIKVRRQTTVVDCAVTIAAITDDAAELCGYAEMFIPHGASSLVVASANSGAAEAMRIASSMSHDFNNLLAIVAGNVQLAAERISDRKIKSLLSEVNLACEMGARMTESMKSFAAQKRLSPTDIDVQTFLLNLTALLGRRLGPSIKLAIVVPGDLPHIIADQSALENAILNLALNARDAMPAGGNITLSATFIEGDGRVCISLKDTGTGMSPHVQAHAFDPFFTTKDPARGTGLGLATVAWFVQQSGGSVTMQSAPGAGTTVSIFLPSRAALP
jgi:signal transduction histidine kinase